MALAPSPRRAAWALAALAAFVTACNTPLPAPTKSGPGPDYEEPGAGDDAGPPLNEKFGDQASELFQGAGHDALKACQTEAQAKGKFDGTVQVHVVLKPDGTLVTAEPRNDSGLPPGLVACLTKQLGALHFPAPGGSRNLAFELPLRFVEAEDAEAAPVDAGAPADAGTPKGKANAKKPPKRPG